MDGAGNWLIGTGRAFTASDGSHSYTVQQTDVAGNVSNLLTSTFSLDTTAPTASTIALESDAGDSSTDGVTDFPNILVTGDLCKIIGK